MDAIGNLWDNLFSDHGKEYAPAPAEEPDPATVTPSVEDQAAQRRLARMSKYYTTPTGIMDDASTGSTGVYS